MSTKLLMSVDEYLHTSFEGSDCEYLDGEVVERNMGEVGHGTLQSNLSRLLWQFRAQLGIHVATEVRIRINSNRFRIPDISVWLGDDIGDRIPTIPPFLAIEILSPDDRMVRMLPKVHEYLSIGVQWVWVIDSEDQSSALCFSRENPAGDACDVLRTENPRLEIPLAAAFDLNA